MSDGIQRAAGSALRSFLDRMTSSKFLAISTGFIITSLIQSSSGSTVLIVGFVNAGLLNVSQSIGLLFGINIGTTVTAWIISVLGFNFSSYQSILPLLIIIIPLIFSRKKSLNAWGDFFMGLILLLIGLFFMRENIPNFSNIRGELSFIEQLAGHGLWSILLFILISMAITVVLQSSTATLALTLVLCNRGWLPFEVASAMVLGSNIGTTSTAEIASLIGNREARMTARIHTFFNFYGVLWAIVLLPFLLRLVDWIGMTLFYQNSAFDDAFAVPVALAVFHTVFNVINVGIFLFIPGVLLYSADKTVPHKKSKAQKDEHLSRQLSNTLNLPELTVMSVKKEVADFATLTLKMNNLVTKMLLEIEHDARENAYQLIKQKEKTIDNFEKVLRKKLSNALSEEVTSKTSFEISGLLNICNELERIGDLYMDMARVLKHKHEKAIWFNTQQRSQSKSLLFILGKEHEVIIEALSRRTKALIAKSSLNTFHSDLKRITQLNENEFIHEKEVHALGPQLFQNLANIADNISDHLYSIFKIIEKDL